MTISGAHPPEHPEETGRIPAETGAAPGAAPAPGADPAAATAQDSVPTGPSPGDPGVAPGMPGAPDPAWAWARPAPTTPQWIETEPLEYHRLLRGAPRYRWWKPLVALLLGFLYYLTFSVVFGLAVILPYLLATGAALTEESIAALAIPDTQNPVSMVMTLGSVALMIPAAVLAMLSVGLTPAKRLWSVALRIRWRWIGRTILPAVVALIVMNGLGIALEFAFAGLGASSALVEAEPVEVDARLALWSMLIVLLLVPFQATAEELVYRGMLMQLIGGWVRNPWVAIVVPSLLFGFSHIYDIWGFLAVVAMALVAGWLSWRTGGLEAAISLHVVNNLVAFGFLALGAGGETGQTAEGGGPGSLIGSALGLALFAWWVDRDFRRRDGARTRIDLVLA